MQIHKGGKSHLAAVCYLQAIRLKILGSHLTYKVANNCFNVRELVEVVQSNFPCESSSNCLVNRKCP